MLNTVAKCQPLSPQLWGGAVRRTGRYYRGYSQLIFQPVYRTCVDEPLSSIVSLIQQLNYQTPSKQMIT